MTKNVLIKEILAFLHDENIPFVYRGDPDLVVNGFSSPSQYKKGTMTWVKDVTNIPNYLDTAELSLVFTADESFERSPNIIRTIAAKTAFFAAIEHFWGSNVVLPSVGSHTYIGPNVKIGRNVCIGSNCTIDGEITIGDNTRIWHHVSMLNRITIGSNCEIRSGVVMGHDDSISYTEDDNRQRYVIKHFGGICVGDNVVIGENSTICRGTIDDTVLEDNVRIDALTMISHNCHLQKNAVLVGGCRLFGSVVVEENGYVTAATVRNQCRIGTSALVGMGAVVTKNVPANETVIGNPAKPFVKKENK